MENLDSRVWQKQGERYFNPEGVLCIIIYLFLVFLKDDFMSVSSFALSFPMIPESQGENIIARTPICGWRGGEEAEKRAFGESL